MNLATTEEIKQLLAEHLEEIKKLIGNNSKKPPGLESEFLDNKETCRALKISPRLLQSWRSENKILGFAKIGHKFFYKRSEIEKIIQDNYNGIGYKGRKSF